MFAIDYDGTLADTNIIKSRWIKRNLDRDLPPYFCDHSTCRPLIGEEVHRRMSLEVYTAAVTAEAPPVPGAVDAVRRLSRRAAIHIVTVRQGPELDWAWQWLDRQGIAGCVRSMVCTKGRSKVAVAREMACRVVVDDDARHLCTDDARGMLLIHLRSGIPDRHRPAGGELVVCASWIDAAERAACFIPA